MHLNSTQLSVCTWLSALNYLLFGFHNLPIFESRSFFTQFDRESVKRPLRYPQTCERWPQRETRSWKGQSERMRILNILSWKKSVLVGKHQAKLKRFFWIWKVSLQLESSGLTWRAKSDLKGCRWSWKSKVMGIHHKEPSKLSHFNSHFPTSARTFQLHSFQLPLPTTRIALRIMMLKWTDVFCENDSRAKRFHLSTAVWYFTQK